MNSLTWDLSVGKERVHPLEKAAVHDVALVKDETDLLILAAWTTNYGKNSIKTSTPIATWK